MQDGQVEAVRAEIQELLKKVDDPRLLQFIVETLKSFCQNKPD